MASLLNSRPKKIVTTMYRQTRRTRRFRRKTDLVLMMLELSTMRRACIDGHIAEALITVGDENASFLLVNNF